MKLERRNMTSPALVGSVTLVVTLIIGTTLGAVTRSSAAATGQIPNVGDKAPAFALKTINGTEVSLSTELAHGPVVLIMLRGWPGYQCPFCTRQFGDFLSHAKELEATGARIVWVYPGPPDQVKQRAQEFTANKQMPGNFRFLIDPDYVFTTAYGLRWDAKGETSYPSTFVIDPKSTVRFAQVSRAHDGRASATDVMKALAALGH